MLLYGGELFALDRRVRHDLQERLVAPDIVFQRRDIEIANQNRAFILLRRVVAAIAHLVEERQLVLELGIDGDVGLVAARRHVEIMHGQRVFEFRLLAESYSDMARVGLAAKAALVDFIKRNTGNHGDAMITLLPVQRDVLIAQPLEALEREGVVGTFGFLQA